MLNTYARAEQAASKNHDSGATCPRMCSDDTKVDATSWAKKKKRKPQETMFCDHHKGAKSSIYGDLIPNDTPIVPH